MSPRAKSSQSKAVRPLPPDLWGYHEEHKKKHMEGELKWYTDILERVATAAYWLVKDPTPETLSAMKAALDHWERRLGWDGKLREGINE